MASKRVLCKHCARAADTIEDNGRTCCSWCGKVVAENLFSTEQTFYKGAGGQVEIVMGLEEAFDVTVEEESAQSIATVQDAADMIERLVESKTT